MPLISVIVPVYNVEKYLNKCVDSILKQTFINLEIILVDDGSTDSSPAICDYYGRVDSRVTVIHKENGGLSSARNSGIDISNGEYLCFIDSDDYVDEHYIEKLYSIVEKTGCDLAVCDFIKIDENYNGLFPESGQFKCEVLSKTEYFKKIDGEDGYKYSVSWNKLYSLKAIGNVRFPEGKIHEDEFTAHLFANNSETIAVTDEPLYFYIQRKGSIMSSKQPARRLDYVEAISGRINFYLSIHYFESLGTLLNKMMFYYYSNRRLFKKEPRISELDSLVKNTIASARPHLKNKKQKIISFFPSFFPILHKIYNFILQNRFSRPLFCFARFCCSKKKQKDFINCSRIRDLYATKEDKLIFLDTPLHGNLGDQAICETEKSLIINEFKAPFFEFTHEEWKRYRNIILKGINVGDTIFLPGGGFLGSLWPNEEKVVISVLRKLYLNRIVIFPQTVYFDEKRKKDKLIFVSACRKCKRLTVFVREKHSLKTMNQIGLGNITKLAPDTVFAFNSRLEIPEKKNNRILLCFRHDKEKKESLDHIETLLQTNGLLFDKSSTIVKYGISFDNRRDFIERKIKEFSRYSLVITDRLHAMIFSLLAKTPCIAFDNLSRKISGVHEWIDGIDSNVICSSATDINIEVIRELITKNVAFNNDYLVKNLSTQLKECYED